MAERSKVTVYSPLLAGIAGSNPAGGMDVCCECRSRNLEHEAALARVVLLRQKQTNR
jgi:hypothetical protein